MNDLNPNSNNLRQQVTQLLQEYSTVLFMKGEKNQPLCGFSAGVVEVLNKLNIDFVGINILANQDLRNFMKEFSNWPTYPQLYHKGELIGGYDIVMQLYETGELSEVLTI